MSPVALHGEIRALRTAISNTGFHPHHSLIFLLHLMSLCERAIEQRKGFALWLQSVRPHFET